MIIGIDLGIKGGIAVIDEKGKIVKLYDMPLTNDDKKRNKRFYKFVDIKKVYDILTHHIRDCNNSNDCLEIVIEDIGNIYGIDKFSMYSLGRQRGIIEGICRCMGVKVIAYPPKIWQGYMFSKINKVINVNSSLKKTKQYAFDVFKLIYPDKVKDVMRRKNPKDGIVDAALIARFHYEMTNDTIQNNDKLK